MVSTGDDFKGNPYDCLYNPGNCPNIFTSTINFAIQKQKEKQRSTQESSLVYITKIFKNMKLTINKIHLRYEDDFFPLSSFACGIVCDQVTSCISSTEWNFGGLENNRFKRTTPKYFLY